jgi:hypothetical protein
VSAGSYENVLVSEEFNEEEPDAFQLKYYARELEKRNVCVRPHAAGGTAVKLRELNGRSNKTHAGASTEDLNPYRHFQSRTSCRSNHLNGT